MDPQRGCITSCMRKVFVVLISHPNRDAVLIWTGNHKRASPSPKRGTSLGWDSRSQQPYLDLYKEELLLICDYSWPLSSNLSSCNIWSSLIPHHLFGKLSWRTLVSLDSSQPRFWFVPTWNFCKHVSVHIIEIILFVPILFVLIVFSCGFETPII